MEQNQTKLERTHIRLRTIIEVLGKPKEHVEKTIREYIEKIKKYNEIIFLECKYSEAEEKDKLWAVFAELEIIVKGIDNVIGFCFDYMPSSLEILKPEEFIIKSKTIQDFLNDLQARLHSVDMIVKKQRNEIDFIKRNMNVAVRNLILISISKGKLNKEQLCRVTGIEEKELDIFLQNLIEEKKIKLVGNFYCLSI